MYASIAATSIATSPFVRLRAASSTLEYLYAGGQDTLYRIHGTNQPEYIGQAISSGCIRLTNEDVIDLYSRVKIGVTVVVL